jgi:OOP family OmpA-OmpF porin
VGKGGTPSEPTSAKYLARWLLSGVLNFEPLRSNLDKKSEGALGEIVRLLRKHGFSQIRLSGHTDGDGANGENLELSERRVKSARQWVNPRLSSGTKVFERYLGELEPIGSNKTVENRKSNRRVEIEVR